MMMMMMMMIRVGAVQNCFFETCRPLFITAIRNAVNN